ncbi:hypothetical protein [Vreelandella jeotgali]|uniref:hypothetical protein n=1 Tax=Vreelandella jeotgali TaxID=553386 RepID=UPI0003457285|nr:hypothetical protein [Halomonas jeotgali]
MHISFRKRLTFYIVLSLIIMVFLRFFAGESHADENTSANAGAVQEAAHIEVHAREERVWRDAYGNKVLIGGC